MEGSTLTVASTKNGAALAGHASSQDWCRRHFSRLLVDMHIPDWDERFLSRLDARTYVDTVAKGRSGAIMLYCNSHVGPTLYPSRLGPVHKALGGRDFVGEVLDLSHEKGLSVVAYYSVIFNNTAFLDHSDWRVIPRQGESFYEKSRYGTCCPNSPYRDFALAQTHELCEAYPFDGIFFDMLFWPCPCYCHHCQARFKKEHGQELPTTINWNNPTWIAFQRSRENWMCEMAGDLTAEVRRARPAMTVTHQMSPILHDWRAGMPYAITEHCDYASGDFYGPPIQHSVACKIFEALSQNKPFEFMTSRCLDLHDHVTTKTVSQMETQSSLALAHAAAFMFIDAIDPIGVLNPPVYERIGSIFNKLAPYQRFLGGALAADVALYVSSESRFDFRENGIDVAEFSKRSVNMTTEFAGAHMTALMGAAQSLQETHIPYAVVTSRNLDELGRYRVIILPNVLVMSDVEISALRRYVADGGSLYASGYSSLVDETGTHRKDFGLADVFGVSAEGGMNHSLSFLTPSVPWLKRPILPQEQAIHQGGWIHIRPQGARVLAQLGKPWCPENEGTVLKPSFSSIHSAPPSTEFFSPAITWHRFGKGRACYSAGAIESEKRQVNRALVAGLIRRLLGGPATVEADAPAFIEITAFDKPGEGKMNISLVSLRQNEEPIPCFGTVRIRLPQVRRAVNLRSLPSRRRVPYRQTEGGLDFDFRDLAIFAIYELEYRLSDLS